jgi:hypothetical protein
MAGTATSWKTTNIAQSAGQLWRGLAIPGAGARLTLFTDGTPDATANPSAKHMGATKAGARMMVKSTLTEYFADEFQAAIARNVDVVNMGISAELLGVTDLDLVAFLLPGVGTKSAGAQYEEVSIGRTAITYDSIADIFPLIEDTTKYGIFHVYRGLNDAGVEWAQGRKELGGIPINIVGQEITTRASTDTLGKIWKQVV